MKSQWIVSACTASLLTWPLFADTITLASGGSVEGIITKIENGKASIQVAAAAGTREIDLREIASVNFDTPHLTEGTAKLPIDHFLKDLNAQEMVRISRDMKQTRLELRRQLDQIKLSWSARQPADQDQARRWAATKETFGAPLSHYRELVGELYLHVLAQVDDYNKLVAEAERVYVGVKGVFKSGSPLIPQDLDQLSVKESVPKNWYDKIFFEGYNRGYREGSDFERLTRLPPPATCEGQW